jgi:hypothetical protein
MTWGIFKSDSVSEAYKKMKAEELKGNQHKLDKNKNGKLDSDDFKQLRKEEAVEEDVNKSDIPAYKRKDDKLTLADLEKERTKNKSHSVQLAKNNGTQKEEAEVSAEELVEYEAKDGVYKHQAKAGRYGGSEKESDYVKGPSNAELKKIEAEKKKKVKEDLDIFSEKEIDILINEVLKASDDAGKWISDFTKSDDPRFAGDSKEQRKKRALAAYYAAQKNESVDYDSFLEEEAQGDIVKMGAKKIKHGNVEDKDDEKDVMEPNSEGEADFLDKHSVQVTDDPAGEYKSGADKLAVSSKPKANGAGKYDGDSKLSSKDKASVKESKDCSCEDDDAETNEEASCSSTGKKKSYTSFKEKMKAKA